MAHRHLTLATALALAGCAEAGGEGAAAPPRAPAEAATAQRAPDYPIDEASWGKFRSKRFQLTVPLPDGRAWKIDDHRAPELVATHAATDSRLALAVESELPWAGGSSIRVSTDRDVNGTVKLRIPGWAVNRPVPGQLYSYADRVAAGPRIAVNNTEVAAVPDALGYVSLDGTWRNGDVITIEFPVEARRMPLTLG